MASDLAALRPLIKTRITALDLGVPVSYQGESFQVPNGTWVRVTLRWGDGEMATGGSGVSGNAVAGVIFLDVFGQRDGLAEDEEIADTLRTSFSRADVGDAFFFAPGGPEVIEDVSKNRAAKWNHVQVQCEFRVKEA